MHQTLSPLRKIARKYKETRQAISLIRDTIHMIVFIDFHQREPRSLTEFLEWLCVVNIEREGNLVKVSFNNNN